MNNRVVIGIFGPPHSGKSVFLNYLYKHLPANSTAIVRTAPDGEGIYSNNANQKEIQMVRNKGKFTDDKTKNNISNISNETANIVLVDTGGRISKENQEIVKECNYAIVLSNNENDKIKWEQFCENSNTKLISSLDSRLEDKDEIYKSEEDDDVLRGKISDLNRGEEKETTKLLNALVNKIVSLAKEKNKSNELDIKGSVYLEDEHVINMDEIAEELNMSKNDAGNIIWDQSRLTQILEKVQERIKGKEAKFFDCRANWMVGATTELAKRKGIENISYYDARKNEFNEVKKLETNVIQKSKRLNINTSLYDVLPDDKLKMIVSQTDKDIFMDLELNTDIKLQIEDMEQMQLPDIDNMKNLHISGKMPAWLLSCLTLNYDNLNKYVLQPGNGFYKYASDNVKDLGENKKEIESINLEKVFNDYREYTQNELQK